MQHILNTALKGGYNTINSEANSSETQPIISRQTFQPISSKSSNADQSLIEEKSLKPLMAHQKLTTTLKRSGYLELISLIVVFVNGANYGWTSTPFLIALAVYLLLYYVDIIGSYYINRTMLNTLENNYQYLQEQSNNASDESKSSLDFVYQLLHKTFEFNKKMTKISLIPGISLITGAIMAGNLVIKGIKLKNAVDTHIKSFIKDGADQYSSNARFKQLYSTVKADPDIESTLRLITGLDNPYDNALVNEGMFSMTLAQFPNEVQTAILEEA